MVNAISSRFKMNHSALFGKRVLLGVTGSIAAYKSAILIRDLKKLGLEVRVIMSPGAKEFITPLTLATLSEHQVYSDFTENIEEGTWSNHVELGLWADIFLIAPLTANTLSDLAHGKGDNLLLATYLSARCPIALAPAMDLDMFAHPSTTANLESLRSRGHLIIGPESGELASGLIGKGRMTEPSDIIEAIAQFFLKSLPLLGKNMLITAGPTFEAIDPVRFIGNRSSGKMGVAIAEELASRGAQVELICGPGSIKSMHPFISRTNVESAMEMYDACFKRLNDVQVVVMTAAVADYRPANPSETKIKKKDENLSLELVKNPDILAEMGQQKRPGQILVGFALETDKAEENAVLKLEKKNLDMIVLNSLQNEGAGFGHDTNQIKLIYSKEKIISFELKSKQEVAKDIANAITSLLNV